MSRALTEVQIQMLSDLADRLEFWGKANNAEAKQLRPWRKKRAVLKTLAIEQLSLSGEIRVILRDEGT